MEEHARASWKKPDPSAKPPGMNWRTPRTRPFHRYGSITRIGASAVVRIRGPAPAPPKARTLAANVAYHPGFRSRRLGGVGIPYEVHFSGQALTFRNAYDRQSLHA